MYQWRIVSIIKLITASLRYVVMHAWSKELRTSQQDKCVFLCSMITSLSVIIAIVVRQKAWRPDVRFSNISLGLGSYSQPPSPPPSPPQAHPLLMLCIADFLLASLFLVGGVLYLDGDGRGYFYAGCFAVSMLTIVSCAVS